MNECISTAARQTVVITGGNQGLGLACAAALAGSGEDWCVIIAGRRREQIATAARELREQTGTHVEPMLLNLASLRSIRFFAGHLGEQLRAGNLPPLRAVICNAAVQVPAGISYTSDGIEEMFGVNHLGHFLLVNLLLPHCTVPARVVIVGGATGLPWQRSVSLPPPVLPAARRLAWPERPEGLRLGGLRRYQLSKRCNLVFAHQLQVQAGGPAVSVNVYLPDLTPGTRLVRGWPGPLRRLWQSPALHALVRGCGVPVASVAASGQVLAGLLLNSEVARLSGQIFQGVDPCPAGSIIGDLEVSQTFWQECAGLVRGQPAAEVPQRAAAAARLKLQAH